MTMRTAVNDGDAGRRRFASGEAVPFDGLFADLWGGCLPLLQGDRFPSHPEMGESKWTYAGPLCTGLAGGRALDGLRRSSLI